MDRSAPLEDSPETPVTLVIAGDLCAAGPLGVKLSQRESTWISEALRLVVGSADIAVVNLECPLTDHCQTIVKSGPVLWGPPGAAAGIRAAGFTVACLANNHILDAGPAGLMQTIEACRMEGIDPVGAGKDHHSATARLTREVGGLRVAILAFAENEFSTTTGARPGAWPFDLIDNARQISEARSEADYLLVLLHGGAEFYPLPSPRMQKACRFFVDMGADAVVCHHSHVVGGNEIYNSCPIVYGVGNLLFDPDGYAPESWFTGCLVRLLARPRATVDMELIPYRQDPTVPNVDLLTGLDRDSLLSRIAELSSTVANSEELARSWGDFCAERRSYFLGSLLCLTRLESWLLDKGHLPGARFRFTPQNLARMRNLFSCESHAEACERMLRDLLEEEMGQS